MIANRSIYRKYYGRRMAVFLFATSYVAMAASGLVVELVFGALGLIPAERAAIVVDPEIGLNYTTVLNLLFLALAAVLVARSARTGGFEMLTTMNE